MEQLPNFETVKEVLRAASFYYQNPSDSGYLVKQLESLCAACSRPNVIRQLHNNDQIEWIECLTFLVNVVREKQSPMELIRPVLKTLCNIVQVESVVKLLYETLTICPHVAGQVIMLSNMAEEEATLQEALKLMQKLTYGKRVDYHQDNMENLLSYLVDVIMNDTQSVMAPALGILSNLCRNNMLVQTAIKNLTKGNFKKLLKKLCMFMDNDNQSLCIFSLSAFVSLGLNEAEGQKAFYDNSNVEHTLQNVFNVMINGFKTGKWKYAADLLVDMLRQPQMQACMKRYRHLTKCMTEFLALLAIGTEETTAELFEVLLNLGAFPPVRHTINTILFSQLASGKLTSQTLLDRVQQPQQQLSSDTDPLLCCLHWSRHCNSFPREKSVSSVALDFLIDCCQDCICTAEGAATVRQLIQPVVQLLSRPDQTQSAQKVARLVKLLSVMCSDKENKQLAGSLLKTSVLSGLVEKQLSNSFMTYAAATSSFVNDGDTRKENGHCIVHILDLAVRLRKFIPDLSTYLSKILRDSRLVDVLALALTSQTKEHVEMALRLLCFASGAEEVQPDVVLCTSVAYLNSWRQPVQHTPQAQAAHSLDHSTLSASSYASLPLGSNKENRRPSPLFCSTPVGQLENAGVMHPVGRRTHGIADRVQQQLQGEPTEQDKKSLENLIGRVGLQDSKSAEVIEIFEHHIKTLQIKEEHLNNLLEAKTMALAQADRVIAQLRAREAAHATEMRKLQGVLKKSEGKIEQTLTEMNGMRIKAEQQQAQRDKQLESKEEEMESLKKRHSELTEKCVEHEDQIKLLSQEKKSVSNMLEDLQKAHETLKEQYLVSCNQSMQLEEERKTLSKQLKEKEAALLQSSTALQALQTKHQSTEKERKELETEKEELEVYVDSLREQLTASKKSYKDLQQKASTLKGITQEQGTKLEQQGSRITELESELEKHNQIVSFINSMKLNQSNAAGKK